LGLELGLRQRAGRDDLHHRAELTARDDLRFDRAAQRLAGAVIERDAGLDEHGQYVELPLARDADFELVSGLGDAPDGILHAARKQRDATHVQHVVGATDKAAERARMAPAAGTASFAKDSEIADQEAELR